MCTKCKNKALKMAGIGKAKSKRRSTKRRTSRRGIGQASKLAYMELLYRAAGAAGAGMVVNTVSAAIIKQFFKDKTPPATLNAMIKMGLGFAAMNYAPQYEIEMMGEGAVMFGLVEFLQQQAPDLFKGKAELHGIGAANYIQLTNEDIHGVEDYLGSVESGTEELVFS